MNDDSPSAKPVINQGFKVFLIGIIGTSEVGGALLFFFSPQEVNDYLVFCSY